MQFSNLIQKSQKPLSMTGQNYDFGSYCLDNLSPRQTLAYLNQHIIGQNKAKRVLAIALRNRQRRILVESEIRNEITPNNIIMIGPTGVGKTALVKRIAQQYSAPWIKVEATKFTEIGFVGRDVESIIRDLMEIAINQVKQQKRKTHHNKITELTEERIINAILGSGEASEHTKNLYTTQLRNGEIDDMEINIALEEEQGNVAQGLDLQGGHFAAIDIGSLINKAFGNKKSKTIKMPLRKAYEKVYDEESEKLVDQHEIINEARTRVESSGIVVIDEFDKIASKNGLANGKAEISREGVQRDLLPLVEGTTVVTKHGPIQTDNILFIGVGAFHIAKPSDLLPELQGRFPVRVELEALTEADLLKIITETKYNILEQYKAIIGVEGVVIDFTDSAKSKIAEITSRMNYEAENIGARRLRTVVDKVMEEISFTANEKSGDKIMIDSDYVEAQLQEFLINKDNLQKNML